MKKSKVLQWILIAIVVIVLLFGIYSIAKRIIGFGKDDSGNDPETTEMIPEATTEAEDLDNSIPMTELKITAPATNMRVGETMQLKIKTAPAEATNTKLKWTCSEEGLVEVDQNGLLTPSPDSGKTTVTMTATATDGSGLSASFDLRIYPEIDPSKPMVAITFDDGPYPETTTPMIDAFEQNYAKCTFFILGDNASYYPDTVKREYDLGLEVGTHTKSHKQLTTLGEDTLKKEISTSIESIKKATGVAPVLMRPPYGSVNKTVLKAVGAQGLCCVNWSLDTEDWKTKNADATYKMVMTATDGDVILLHDIHEYNVDAVKRFVPDLIAKGYQLVTVSEMYKARGETLDPGTLHFRTDPTTESAGETGSATSETSQ